MAEDLSLAWRVEAQAGGTFAVTDPATGEVIDQVADGGAADATRAVDAAYRAFRARNPEATLLLAAAVIVMLGRVPLGELVLPALGPISEWILSVLNASARRAILIGISVGAIAMSVKIIFGIERGYLGGGRD